MNNTDNANDILNFAEENKSTIPQGLNVLTILTFIGSGILFIFALIMPFLMKFFIGMMDKASSMNPDMSDKQLAEMAKGRHVMELTQQNIVPLTIVNIIAIAACVLGAVWMRKLKKDGFWIYVAGELLPIAAGLIFIGTEQYVDWKNYLGLLVVAIFIILYAMQKKYLIK